MVDGDMPSLAAAPEGPASREVIATLHPSHLPLRLLFRLTVLNPFVEEIATELNCADRQSCRAIYPV